jgi:OHCU decarboxylase
MNLIDKINKLTQGDFISIFGNVFEKTNWVAEKTYAFKPFNNFEELHSKMLDIFENSTKEKHLKILNSHPDLAVEKVLTLDSKKEQSNARLDQCSEQEFKEFKKLNEKYKKKNGFPFIITVKGKNIEEILNNFRQRITNNIDTEFNEAKNQVKKIASLRLNEITKSNLTIY